jgi:hypothetical protein
MSWLRRVRQPFCSWDLGRGSSPSTAERVSYEYETEWANGIIDGRLDRSG